MRTIPLVCFLGMAIAGSAISQDTLVDSSSDPVVDPAAPTSTVRTFITQSLEVPVFSPPAQPVLKQVPAMRVEAAVTVPTTNGRTLTILRGEASTLPDLPHPPVTQPQARQALTQDEIDRAAYNRRHMLLIGATIYDHRVSQVHWRHPDTGEFYEALCGFDVGLLGGIGQFIDDGETYRLMLTHFDFDSTMSRRLARNSVPARPEVLPEMILVMKGNPQDPVGTAPITMLRELIASEKSRLIPYQAARLSYQQASAAWNKAHPPVPRNETIWFKPHRGSRYLANEGGGK